MTETFLCCQTNLIAMLPQYPSKEEIEVLLRITPQGIAKINTDLIRGISASVTLKEMTNAFLILKEYLKTYSGEERFTFAMSNGLQLTCEEKDAVEWSLGGMKLEMGIFGDAQDYIDHSLCEYRKFRINKEAKRLSNNGEKVGICGLASSKFTMTMDYIVKGSAQIGKREFLSINPIFSWFDCSIVLDTHHFRSCQPLFVRRSNIEQISTIGVMRDSIDEIDLTPSSSSSRKSCKSNHSSRTSFELLQSPTRRQKVKFEGITEDEDPPYYCEDSPPLKPQRPLNIISLNLIEGNSSLDLKRSSSEKIVLKFNNILDRIRRPTVHKTQ